MARRKGEADYDSTFSFIGGKMETTDEDIIAGLVREKNEEIGKAAKVRVYMSATNNLLFRKKDGSSVILPHYLAQYTGGEIVLNPDEYSEFRWVAVENLPQLTPKIENIPELVAWALSLRRYTDQKAFVEI